MKGLFLLVMIFTTPRSLANDQKIWYKMRFKPLVIAEKAIKISYFFPEDSKVAVKKLDGSPGDFLKLTKEEALAMHPSISKKVDLDGKNIYLVKSVSSGNDQNSLVVKFYEKNEMIETFYRENTDLKITGKNNPIIICLDTVLKSAFYGGALVRK